MKSRESPAGGLGLWLNYAGSERELWIELAVQGQKKIESQTPAAAIDGRATGSANRRHLERQLAWSAQNGKIVLVGKVDYGGSRRVFRSRGLPPFIEDDATWVRKADRALFQSPQIRISNRSPNAGKSPIVRSSLWT